MEKNSVEQRLDRASQSALDARSRIEAAVDAGLIPIWVLEACETLEQGALDYGTARAELKMSSRSVPTIVVAPPEHSRLH